MARATPLRNRLIAKLIETLRRSDESGTPIPTVRAMALANGVAYETMWKAADQARRMDVVTMSPGRGVRLTRGGLLFAPALVASTPAQPSPLPGRKWEQIRDSVAQRLAQGGFAHAPLLPPIKTLCEEFGASHSVMRTALLSLCAEGELEVGRGGYRVARSTRPMSSGAVVLVTGALEAGAQLGRAFVRNWDLLRALETVCASAGVRLERPTRPVDYLGYCSRAQLEKTRGFILWAQGLERPGVDRIVAALADTGRPLAVLDESDAVSWSGFDTPQSSARLFTMGNSTEAGRIVGTFLRNLGHRHIAYFSPLRVDTRLVGLRRALDRGGDRRSLREYRVDPDTINTAAARLGTDDILVADVSARALSQMLAQVRQDLQPHVVQALAGAAHYAEFERAFMEALRDNRITAWVGANDITALQCLRFLDERKIDVPRRLSVVGFDDTADAALRGLTSYDFNVAGLAHAMVHHILHPLMLRERQGSPGPSEVSGHVTVRATTSRANGTPI